MMHDDNNTDALKTKDTKTQRPKNSLIIGFNAHKQYEKKQMHF